MNAEVERVARDALEESSTPGCAVAISHKGVSWEAGLGLASVRTGLPFSPRTRIPIASMTKPYTATAVMALVEAGRVELDAPVRRYLPEFRVADEASSDGASVRHLLNHTSGWAGDLGFDSEDRGDKALARVVAEMATLPQILPVGSTFSYSNAGFMLAGRLVEAITGMPFETAVTRLILEPLALRATAFFAESAITHPLAVGHSRTDDDGWEVIDDDWGTPRCIHPAGGLISDVSDQLRWTRWWLGELDDVVREPVSAATRARMCEPGVAGGNLCDAVGIGWMLDRLDGGDVLHHSGTLDGIATYSCFVPAAELAIVVLANAADGLLVHKRVRDYVLERVAGLRLPVLETSTCPRSELAEYLGRYRLPGATEGPLEVEAEGGGLLIRPPEGGGALRGGLRAEFHARDEVVIGEGFAEGLRAEFLRDATGSVWALRFGARVIPRAEAGAD